MIWHHKRRTADRPCICLSRQTSETGHEDRTGIKAYWTSQCAPMSDWKEDVKAAQDKRTGWRTSITIKKTCWFDEIEERDATGLQKFRSDLRKTFWTAASRNTEQPQSSRATMPFTGSFTLIWKTAMGKHACVDKVNSSLQKKKGLKIWFRKDFIFKDFSYFLVDNRSLVEVK